MDFTEIYKQTAGLVSFSPGTHFILTAANDRVVIRRADSFQVARTWQLLPPEKATAAPNSAPCRISHAAWSCDSEYVLAACAKKGFLNVFKLRDESWNARIDAGLEGLVKAEWAPDGRSILCFSDMGVSFPSTHLLDYDCNDGSSGSLFGLLLLAPPLIFNSRSLRTKASHATSIFGEKTSCKEQVTRFVETADILFLQNDISLKTR